jgi:hypothetical protein
LRELNLDFNPISTFKGAVQLPSLGSISDRSAHLTGRPHNSLMCLILFDSQITARNSVPVASAMRARADLLRELTVERLRARDFIKSVDPVTSPIGDGGEKAGVPQSLASLFRRVFETPAADRRNKREIRKLARGSPGKRLRQL